MGIRGQFAVVRPYGERIRKRVFAFLNAMELSLAQGKTCPAATPNVEAAQWASGLDVDFFLIPFHLHKDSNGSAVDGLGVVNLLSDACLALRRPILMPVSAYSLNAAFPRRLSEVADAKPQAHKLIIPMGESAIGSQEIRTRLLDGLVQSRLGRGDSAR